MKHNSKPTALYRLARTSWDALTYALLAPIYESKGRDIERLVLFIGYGRSGSSLVSALLNSHPEAVIAFEGAFQTEEALRDATRWRKGRITRRILDQDRHIRDTTSYGRMGGYPFAVNSPWQGTYSRLRVVGYKHVGRTTRCLRAWPGALDSLRRMMGVPISALFPYRNPYDMIAAEYLRHLRAQGQAIPRDLSRFSPTPAQTQSMEQAFFSPSNLHFAASRDLASVLPLFSEYEVLPVKHEEFIASPMDSLRRVCKFLGLECTEDYLKACTAIVYPSPHQTRFKVRWTSQQKAQVEELIRRCPWFEGYDFENSGCPGATSP